MTVDLADVLGETTIARLRDVIGDRADAVVGVATLDAEILWASAPGSQEVFGRRQRDVEGHSQYEYVHPRDHARFRRQLALATAGETVRFTVRAQTADGSWVRVSTVAWAVTTTDEQLIVTITVPADDV